MSEDDAKIYDPDYYQTDPCPDCAEKDEELTSYAMSSTELEAHLISYEKQLVEIRQDWDKTIKLAQQMETEIASLKKALEEARGKISKFIYEEGGEEG